MSFTLDISDVFPGSSSSSSSSRSSRTPTRLVDLNRGFTPVSRSASDPLHAGSSPGDSPWRNMEGPSFYCAYLGFTPVSKPPTGIGVLQTPVKDLYFKYRRTPAGGRSASLKLTQTGVLVILYEDGAVKAELFFEFTSFSFVDAVKFAPVKSSSERKPKALFVSVDEAKGQASDKNAFLLEKNLHFLVSSTHPPLVVCVVRRPQGVKALDCHVFALDTIENALHITSLIGSTQMPAGGGRGDVGVMTGPGELSRGKGGVSGFDRNSRGDVIRTEYGEYSVYRGPTGGGPDVGQGQQMRYHSGHGGGGGGGRNGAPPATGVKGSLILTQDDFRREQQLPSPSPAYGNKGGHSGDYEQQGSGSGGGLGAANIHGAVPFRLPDVVHGRTRSGDSGDGSSSINDRSFSAGSDQGGGVAMRYDDTPHIMRNTNINSNLNNSGHRLSGGLGSPRPPDFGQPPAPSRFPSDASTSFSSRPSDSGSHGQPVSPRGGAINSPRSPVFSPTSPRGSEIGGGLGSPGFSASNLESRGRSGSPELEAEDRGPPGKPVAKVPPHMKAGVKVLPSDFRMVKLKPKTEKRSDSTEDVGYDNNRDIMAKYKELQEIERGGANTNPSGGAVNNYPDGNDFRNFSEVGNYRHSEHERDFLSHWDEPLREGGRGGQHENHHRQQQQHHHHHHHNPNHQNEGLDSSFYRQQHQHHQHGGQHNRYEDNNNKNRYSAPVFEEHAGFRAGGGGHWGGGGGGAGHNNVMSQSSHGILGMPSDDKGAPPSRTKDAEIADMFSNFRLQGGNSGDSEYRHGRERNEFEEGLGYLP